MSFSTASCKNWGRSNKAAAALKMLQPALRCLGRLSRRGLMLSVQCSGIKQILLYLTLLQPPFALLLTIVHCTRTSTAVLYLPSSVG